MPTETEKEVRVWEIANPSDKYTIKGTQTVCDVAVLYLGNGAYGLMEAEKPDLGIMLFLGSEEAIEKRIQEVLGCTIEEYLNAHREEVADALDSVVIGNRDLFENTLECIPDAERAAFIERWNDKCRSSLNNIGARAKELARRLREEIPSDEASD